MKRKSITSHVFIIIVAVILAVAVIGFGLYMTYIGRKGGEKFGEIINETLEEAEEGISNI